ncbi:MAG: recombination protein RecR [Deltaproteobacteria bacterium]|nr:MAG: recombination protein RecR [Deltaproteobacteria bacterium]
MLPSKVQQLVQLLARLPGVGDKTAQRFALFLAASEMDTARALGDALHAMADGIGSCARCGHIAEVSGPDTPPCCDICGDNKRDSTRLCVVARIQDLLSIERSNAFRGHYFVLGRLLSPLEGVGAEELPVDALKLRIDGADPPVTEVLIATPPSVDGEATALLLAQELAPLDVQVSRLASGVPHGGDLEFADPITIGRAIAGRRGMD